jgi:hypothetical protein
MRMFVETATMTLGIKLARTHPTDAAPPALWPRSKAQRAAAAAALQSSAAEGTGGTRSKHRRQRERSANGSLVLQLSVDLHGRSCLRLPDCGLSEVPLAIVDL